MILAGDIGGTKTHLGLFEASGVRPRAVRSTVFQSAQYPGLGEIVGEFLQGASTAVSAAAFGVAGPVIDGNVTTTNLPWHVVAKDLSELLGGRKVTLLNDLESIGYGVAMLSPGEYAVLNEGKAKAGNAGIVAAGTGLGIAGLFWDGKAHVPSASEGGHVDFAPRNDLEIELLRFMHKRHKHVSVERLLSGPGLFTIYEFLRSSGHANESHELAARLATEDPSSAISAAGLSGESALAKKAIDVFTDIYGATAGNLALTLMATGGIYVAGGIAPKIISKLMDGSFMNAFLDKGRFRNLLSEIPVRVSLNPDVGLLGAASVASRLI